VDHCCEAGIEVKAVVLNRRPSIATFPVVTENPGPITLPELSQTVIETVTVRVLGFAMATAVVNAVSSQESALASGESVIRDDALAEGETTPLDR